MHRLLKYCLAFSLSVIGWGAVAGEADVLKVRVLKERNSYGFIVTVRHGDNGWKHYANRWEVLSPNGKKILAVRKLLHPHDKEQPFTRRLTGIKIPSRYKSVIIRAHDKVHGYGGRAVKVPLK